MSVFTSLSSLGFKSRSPQQIISDRWEERERILQKNVNLFCWKRPEDLVISTYLGRIQHEDLKPIVFHTNVEDLAKDVLEVRNHWDYGPFQAANRFWGDVSNIVHDFLHFSKNQSGTVHLKLIDNNSCAKFHTDGYTLRLFTTYFGKGTEWLPEKATNREGLGKTNELIVKDASQIQQMDPFEVGILKGELPTKLEFTRGIVHKSPMIDGSGEKRIILRVDI